MIRITILGVFIFASWACADPLWGSNSRAGSDPGAVIRINDATGTGFLLGDPSAGSLGMTGLAFDNDGRLFGSTIAGFGSTSRLYEIDPVTGALIQDIGDIAAPNVVNIPISIGDLAYDPTTDTMYGMWSNADGTGNGGFITSFDRTTGVAIDVWGPLPTTAGGSIAGGGLAINADGTMYAVGFRANTFVPVLFEVGLNKPNLILTEVAELPTYFDALGVRADGMLFGAPGGNSGGTIYSIDPTSGTVTALGAPFAQGWRVSDLAFQSPVPEPSTLALLAGVLGGAILLRTRRRR